MSTPSEIPSNLPPQLTSLDCHRALRLNSLCHTENSDWLSILHTAMHVSMLLFQLVPLSPSHTVSTSLSMSVSPLVPWIQVHQYHLSRFHRYVLVYDSLITLYLFFISLQNKHNKRHCILFVNSQQFEPRELEMFTHHFQDIFHLESDSYLPLLILYLKMKFHC